MSCWSLGFDSPGLVAQYGYKVMKIFILDSGFFNDSTRILFSNNFDDRPSSNQNYEIWLGFNFIDFNENFIQ